MDFRDVSPAATPTNNWAFKPKNQGYNPGRTSGRKHGRRGGVQWWIRQLTRKNQFPLPSMVLANVQSLRNKIDEPQANATLLREFRKTCIMALKETWLNYKDGDSTLDIRGFGTLLFKRRRLHVCKVQMVQ